MNELYMAFDCIQKARVEPVEYEALLMAVTVLSDHYMELFIAAGSPAAPQWLDDKMTIIEQANDGTKYGDGDLIGASEVIHYHCMELERALMGLHNGQMVQPN